MIELNFILIPYLVPQMFEFRVARRQVGSIGFLKQMNVFLLASITFAPLVRI